MSCVMSNKFTYINDTENRNIKIVMDTLLSPSPFKNNNGHPFYT